MSEISSPTGKAMQTQREKELRDYVIESRKIREDQMSQLNSTKSKAETNVSQMQKDYEVKFSQEKAELEGKLGEIREKHLERMNKEHERYEQELSDLRKAHEIQIGEVKSSQIKDLERLERQHKTYMQNAKTKFEAEKTKNRA